MNKRAMVEELLSRMDSDPALWDSFSSRELSELLRIDDDRRKALREKKDSPTIAAALRGYVLGDRRKQKRWWDVPRPR